MLQVEDALKRIVALMPVLSREKIALGTAAGRVLAQSFVSPIDLPRFDNSAMDGYAVRANDIMGATEQSPVKLRRVGAVAAGERFEGTLDLGTCVRLFTGSPLPEGADAVVMQEDTSADGDEVLVFDRAKPWENVRLAGEDVKAGAVLVGAGQRLDAAHLAVIGAVGGGAIDVSRQPRVAILSTGNELIEAGEVLRPGQIYESNRTAIAALVTRAGGIPLIYPLVPDTLAATQDALRQVFAECDVVVTTGGVSVGEHDHIKQAFTAIGGMEEFWQVAMKPGKPFLFGRFGKKFLFGLPGNPVSAFVTFLVLARPGLLKMQGVDRSALPEVAGVLVDPLKNRGPRRHYVRVILDSAGNVSSAGVQASHALGTLARANGLVSMPPDTSWTPGQVVRVLRWDG